METICGIDCNNCEAKEVCKGCAKTGGHPLGGNCIVANCCQGKKDSDCLKKINEYKLKLINEFNSLGIEDMPEITELFQLIGSFINQEYTLPGGLKVKFWKDNDIYLGTEVHKKNSELCYGLAASDDYLFVCEYAENGSNPQIVLFKKRV